MAELEKAGVPTVAFVAQTFERDWQASARVFGFKDLPAASVRRPLVGLDANDINPLVEAAFETLVQRLTQPMGQHAPEESAPASELITLEAEDRYAALERMNAMFLENGWSDGFPLWPPTRERVDEMLAGTKRAASQTVAVLAPGKGIASVEKIAINAVMAGCRPEHLPVLIAAVEAIGDPRFMMRNVAMSTGAHAPMLLLNGPIVARLGVNTGRCALGPGALSAVNTVLGRAVRLIYMNLGHAYPGHMDLDTLGSPTKYSMCLGENVEASPWAPFHVEQGFESDTSVATMFTSYALSEVEDNYGTTPEALLSTAALSACNPGVKRVGYWLCGWRGDPDAKVMVKDKHLLIVCPVHAAVFRKAGWSKQQVREHLYKHARMSFAHLIAKTEAAAFRKSHPQLQWLWDSPATRIPILETPECFELFVAGGMGGRSCYSYGAGEPISRRIEA
jgi:hypothetical protein